MEDFPHGDTFLPDQIPVINEITGLPVDVTAYASAAMRIEEKDGTEVVTLTDAAGITLGNGFIEFSTETTTWPNNCTLYADLQMITAGGKTETWAKFIIKVKKTITIPV